MKSERLSKVLAVQYQSQYYWLAVSLEYNLLIKLTGGQPLIKTKRGWGFRVYSQIKLNKINSKKNKNSQVKPYKIFTKNSKKIKIPKTPKIIFTYYFV